MEKKQKNLYWGISVIIFLIIATLAVIINYISPTKIQIYAKNAHVFVQVVIFIISLIIIAVGFYFFKKLANDFDREFNQ
ncbi:hypothetical protein NEF87_000657 [Candidatus Lokiarchaeum ossiferum]|uniref:Uncharacterized protein n=1 Tax=Candidatus Lokiarchaeum ossiferum TaxID=2951803 RepID=A0ABY6HLI4_9ARCH|nr:hypothetical protein NEF87_000657 [Candidatus Lokiarchaeum sp. B-35]